MVFRLSRTALLLALVAAGAGCGDGDAPGTTAPPASVETAPPPPPPEPGPPPTGPPPPSPPTAPAGLPPDVEALPRDPARAAGGLRASVRCEQPAGGEAVAALRWRPARERGSGQRIVVTIFAEGLSQGNYEASRALPPDRSRLLWRRVSGQAIHTWHVLTRHGETWIASPAARFEGPVCVVDETPP